MNNVHKIRPLRARYNPEAPYIVERDDHDDGAITFDIVDSRPDSYGLVCIVPDTRNAKQKAERVAQALNLLVAKEAFDKRDPDDYPGPKNAELEAIWQDGITYGMDRLGSCLNVTGWDRDGASESVEGDVNHEICSIMRLVAVRQVKKNGGAEDAPGFDAAVDAIIDQLAGR